MLRRKLPPSLVLSSTFLFNHNTEKVTDTSSVPCIFPFAQERGFLELQALFNVVDVSEILLKVNITRTLLHSLE